MRWSDTITAFDTETTGTGPDARIIEIGIVVFRDGVEQMRWSCLLDPGVDQASDETVESWQQALSVNKISLDELRGKPKFDEVAQTVRQLLSEGTLAAHNAAFDKRMLVQEADRSGFVFDYVLSRRCIDTMHADFGLNPGKLKRRLDAVAKRWGVESIPNHRAVDDARTCGQVLLAMKDKLPPRYEDLEGDLAQWGLRWEELRRKWASNG